MKRRGGKRVQAMIYGTGRVTEFAISCGLCGHWESLRRADLRKYRITKRRGVAHCACLGLWRKAHGGAS